MAETDLSPAPTSLPLRMSPVASVSGRDGVVNEICRAVVLGTIKPGEKLTEVQLSGGRCEGTHRTALLAPAEFCRAAILGFRAHGGGIIVNVTSRSAHRGDDADHLAYGAAKGGLLALTKGLASGYGKENILAYAVAPGWVATDIAGDLANDPAVLAGLPLGEVTPPQDVAEVIAFLASSRSRYSTGLTMDGRKLFEKADVYQAWALEECAGFHYKISQGPKETAPTPSAAA